jgi:hypothetical protein
MQVVNRKGELFNVDGDIVPDGCSLRTSVFMLDGLDDTQREIARSFSRPAQIVDAIGRPCGNRPGHAFITSSGILEDAASAASDAREAYRKRMCDAWQAKPAEPDEPDEPDDESEIDDARELRKAQISSAWRAPSINPAETKARVFRAGWESSYRPYMEADAADAAHAEMTRRVCDAWRHA